MRGIAFLGFVTQACTFSGAPTETSNDDGGTIDAPSVDAPSADAPLAMRCEDWSPAAGHFDPCMIVQPMALDLSMTGTYVVDTDAESLSDPGGSNVAIASEVLIGAEPAFLISVPSLAIGADTILRAEGDRPLIIAAWSGITVAGMIDVRSAIGLSNGAGANPEACDATAAQPGTDGNSPAERGGGGGGGYGAAGGDGGPGNDGDSQTQGTGGSVILPPTIVHGGCPGAVGGGADGGGGGGGRGSGGGAIQLSAFSTITITGTLNANGAGGLTTGTTLKGGGGAGSGGYVGLDAPNVGIQAAANVNANGGGGGEGNGDGGQTNGNDGAVGIASVAGGANSQDGGDGGAGGAQAVETGGNGSMGSKGGGGGGGGVGFILVWSSNLENNSTLVSPMITEPVASATARSWRREH